MKIIAEITKILHNKENENNSSVWVKLSTKLGSLTGTMPWAPKVGENIEFEGKWTVWNGQKQFSFKTAKPVIPEDQRGLLHYICSMAKGIGESLEEKIWNKLGDDWANLKQGDVKGITENKYANFLESLEYVKLHKSQAEAISFMLSHGLTFDLSNRVWEEYGKETIGKINANCYCLTEISQVGFSKVDSTIRTFFNIQDEDKIRIESGIKESFKLAIKQTGSTLFNVNEIIIHSHELLKIDETLIKKELIDMIKNNKLYYFFGIEKITLNNIYQQEKKIAEYITC